MKTTKIIPALLLVLSVNFIVAQDRTTVTATNSEISDNLDLRAVASIFGDSKDLSDFEYRLNNPEFQISNLDLNNDNTVDYLRVIETIDGNTHLIIIQSVIGRDLFQDIASVEVVKDRNNRVQVQVVGDVFMYGSNYIYEPVYAFTPVIYNSFWLAGYHPYYSSWNWGYYPSYYIGWNPFPIFRYRNNINVWINFNHNYNYVTTRNCGVAYNNYYRGRRGNYYETQHPNRSFSNRNNGFTNRYELDRTRNTRNVGISSTTNSGTTRGQNNGTRNSSVSGNNSTRNNGVSQNNGIRSASTRDDASTRETYSEGTTRNSAQNNGTRNNSTRNTATSSENVRNNGNENAAAGTTRNSSATPVKNNTRSNNSSTRSTTRDANTKRSSSTSGTTRSASAASNQRSGSSESGSRASRR